MTRTGCRRSGIGQCGHRVSLRPSQLAGSKNTLNELPLLLSPDGAALTVPVAVPSLVATTLLCEYEPAMVPW